MFKDFKITWNGAFLLTLWVLSTSLVVLLVVFCCAKKFTHQYTLGDKDGVLTITKEIDWCEDDEIQLDRNITYPEAIRLVDSLNKTLKK